MQTESFYLGTLVKFLRDSGKLKADVYGGDEKKNYSHQHCADALGIKRPQLTNLLDGDTQKHFDMVRDLFAETIQEHYEALPQPLQVMAQTLYDLNLPSAQAGIADILLQGTIQDPEQIAEFCEHYAGIYTVWRYAGHLERTAHPYQTEDGEYWARVVRAALEITPGDPHPMFRIRYKPQNTKNERGVEGVVLRVGTPGHIYFWGHEETSGYPLIMVARHELHGSSQIECLVVRKHEADRVFTARVILVRQEDGIDFDEMPVGMFHEGEVANEIAEFANLMENETHLAQLVGTKSALVL